MPLRRRVNRKPDLKAIHKRVSNSRVYSNKPHARKSVSSKSRLAKWDNRDSASYVIRVFNRRNNKGRASNTISMARLSVIGWRPLINKGLSHSKGVSRPRNSKAAPHKGVRH